MHPQLDTLATEYLDALDRLHALVAAVPADRWPERRDPDRWSVSECVAHLNLTSQAYLPLIHDALAEARATGAAAPARYRRDPAGWLLWATMGPPVRIRTRTIAAFVPEGRQRPDQLVAEFERLQDAQVAALREASGLPLGRVRITSPFNPRLTYNLYSCFGILARHQHRHLWQADRVWPRGTG